MMIQQKSGEQITDVWPAKPVACIVQGSNRSNKFIPSHPAQEEVMASSKPIGQDATVEKAALNQHTSISTIPQLKPPSASKPLEQQLGGQAKVTSMSEDIARIVNGERKRMNPKQFDFLQQAINQLSGFASDLTVVTQCIAIAHGEMPLDHLKIDDPYVSLSVKLCLQEAWLIKDVLSTPDTRHIRHYIENINSDDTKLKMTSTAMLANLCAGHVIDELISSNAIELVVEQIHSSDPIVQAHAARAIENLAEKHNVVCDTLITEATIRRLIEMLQAERSRTQGQAALALAHLGRHNDSQCTTIINMGAIDPLIALLYGDDPKTQGDAAKAISFLVFNRDIICDRFVYAGVMKPLVALLRSQEPMVVDNAVLAIANLISSRHSLRDDLFFEDNIELLLALLQRGSCSAKYNAARVFVELISLGTEQCMQLVDDGIVFVLLTALSDSTPKQHSLLMTSLSNLITKSERICEKMIDIGVVYFLLERLEKDGFKTISHLMCIGKELIEYIDKCGKRNILYARCRFRPSRNLIYQIPCLTGSDYRDKKWLYDQFY